MAGACSLRCSDRNVAGGGRSSLRASPVAGWQYLECPERLAAAPLHFTGRRRQTTGHFTGRVRQTTGHFNRVFFLYRFLYRFLQRQVIDLHSGCATIALGLPTRS